VRERRYVLRGSGPDGRWHVALSTLGCYGVDNPADATTMTLPEAWLVLRELQREDGGSSLVRREIEEIAP